MESIKALFLLSIFTFSGCALTVENPIKVSRVSETEYKYTDSSKNQLQVELLNCFRDIRSNPPAVVCHFYWNSITEKKANILIDVNNFSYIDKNKNEFNSVNFYGIDALKPTPVIVHFEKSPISYALWEKQPESRRLSDFLIAFEIPNTEEIIPQINFDKRVTGISFSNIAIRQSTITSARARTE